MLITKQIYQPTGNTSIALEAVYWTAIQGLAGKKSISHWVREQLENKPKKVSAASWLRQTVLISNTKLSAKKRAVL